MTEQILHPSVASRLEVVHQCVAVYRTPTALPTTIPSLLQIVQTTKQEVLRLFEDGHSPLHKEVPYRLAFMVFQICLVEQAGLPQQETHTLLVTLFSELGVSPHVAVELAAHRYQRLCEVQPAMGIVADHVIRHIDESELVLLISKLLGGR